MSPLPPGDGDLMDLDLPAVPRLRRPSAKVAEGAEKRTTSLDRGSGRSRNFSRSKSSEISPDTRSAKRPGDINRSRQDDDNENASDRNSLGRRSTRVPRRAAQARKIVDDEDDDDADDEEDVNDEELHSSGSNSASPSRTKSKRKPFAKDSTTDRSDSLSPPPAKKSKRQNGKGTASDSTSKDGDPGTDGADTGMDEVVPGQNDILAQLEKEVANEDLEEYDSDDSEEREITKKPERLTRRQRAMQGENVALEYTKLESPKAKKKAPEEEWSHDEEVELKRQQKARLRQMINEKRNKEKRAAMVDKVLRGVTSKRKKFTMASEARAAQVGSRLSQNEMREGCIRFISNKDGVSLSLPKEINEPIYLQSSVKAVYPRMCKRDPKTGKRIFTEV